MLESQRTQADRRLHHRRWQVFAAKQVPVTQVTGRLGSHQGARSSAERTKSRAVSRTFLWFSRPLSPRDVGGTAGFWVAVDLLAAFILNVAWQGFGWMHTLEEPAQTGVLEDILAAVSTAASNEEADLSFAVLLAAAAMFAAVWIPIMSAMLKNNGDLRARVEFSIFAGLPILTLVAVVSLISGWNAAGSSTYGKYAFVLCTAVVLLASLTRSMLWRRSRVSQYLRDSQIEQLTTVLGNLSQQDALKIAGIRPTQFFWSAYLVRVLGMLLLPVAAAFAITPSLWRQQLLMLLMVAVAVYPYLCTVASRRCRVSGVRATLVAASLALTIVYMAFSLWFLRFGYNLVPARVLVSEFFMLTSASAPLALICFDRYMRDAQVWTLAADRRLLRVLKKEQEKDNLPKPNVARIIAHSTDVWCKPWWVLAGRLLRKVQSRYRREKSMPSNTDLAQYVYGESRKDLRVSHPVKSDSVQGVATPIRNSAASCGVPGDRIALAISGDHSS